ncbi:hypothetical protein ABN125_09590 [Proteus terrae]|uniref:Uncharacterized protein n=1 Tax=Proteus columbae TaxID=1987580 RepID=A0A6I7D5V6_9GAMM|nr:MULTISPECIES: hypothetical protein [Proteus]MBG3020410.1 hypothetical protein [Proteus mirabilis]MBI6340475.1 hypothetical protein [Proteus sp. PR00224]QHN10094.1 hypothetical protein F1325_06315 [Proteus columbae]QKJ47735.1 hypothetical protein G9394_01860 [Proteus vulgaris]GLX62268.1 hypothetical protein KMU_03080 [Proteus vulgaris]
MDKSRMQFESWFNNQYSGYNYDEKLISFVKAQLFIVWQASRESLLLNLPIRERNKGNYDYFTDGYNSGISACEIALLDSGVKIKNG